MTAPASCPPVAALSPAQIERALLLCNEVAQAALQAGHHPFGALLLAPDGDRVLERQGNIDSVQHAESTLALHAARRYAPDYLWQCTLVSTVEPCAMCAATQYWSHIGRLVYAMSEAQLRELTGAHPANPTLALPCRSVFASGQKPIQVIGPLPALQAPVAALHANFWSRN
jgi:tRNA(Arg) A34 adenosine deaminase TadA